MPGVAIAVYFWKKDIVSLYYGSAFGYCLLSSLQLYYIFTSDWEFFAQEALKRVNKKDEEFEKVDQKDDEENLENTI